MSYPGYPSSNSGYPPAPSYPLNPGMPQAGVYPSYPGQGGAPSPYQNPAYPSGAPAPTGYPSSGYPSAPMGYPSAQPTYPSAGYPAPMTQAGGYLGGMSMGQQPSYPQAPMPNAPQMSGGYGGAPSPYGGAPMAGAGYPGMPSTATSPYGGPMATAPSMQQPAYSNPQQYPQQQPYSATAPQGQMYSPAHQQAQMTPANQGSPTVKPHHPFDASQDAHILKKAMKGFGTDEKTIIAILTRRTNAQRQQIYVSYKSLFGKDLTKQLRSELGGRLEEVVLALMLPRFEYLATQLNKAIAVIGTKEMVLIEILCSSTNTEIRELNAAYQRMYNKTLDREIASDTSGYYKRLMVGLCMGNRNENAPVDHGRASQDAQALYRAGAAKLGTDESTFQAILVSQSFPQLQAVFHEYERQTGKSIEQALNSEMSGYLLSSMLALVKCIRNRPAYFAERLHNAIQGMGTDDNTLIRIVVTRCEVDMVQIKQEFARNYGKSLESKISNDTSGDYKRVLLGLIE